MENAFNKYFLPVTDNKIIHNCTNQSHFISNNINPSNYLHDALKQPFLNIKWEHRTYLLHGAESFLRS
jgi:hypothetical protein